MYLKATKAVHQKKYETTPTIIWCHLDGFLEPKGLQPHITELKSNIWNVGIIFWTTDNDIKMNMIYAVEWTTYAVVKTDVKQLKIAQDISVFYVLRYPAIYLHRCLPNVVCVFHMSLRS